MKTRLKTLYFCPKRTPEYQLKMPELCAKVQGILSKNRSMKIGMKMTLKSPIFHKNR